MLNYNSWFLMHCTHSLRNGGKIVLATEEMPDEDIKRVKELRGKGLCEVYTTEAGFETAFSCADKRPKHLLRHPLQAHIIISQVEQSLLGTGAHVVICAPATVLDEILQIILRELLPDNNGQNNPFHENDFAILRIEESQLLMDRPEEVSAAA